METPGYTSVVGDLGTITAPTQTYTYTTQNYGAPSAVVRSTAAAFNPYSGTVSTAVGYVATHITAYSAQSFGDQQRTGTVSYTTGALNSRYSSFLEREYNQTGALPVNEQGQTAYDLQRQGIDQQYERERQLRTAALQRQLAAQGMSDSGLAFKQMQQLNQSIDTAKEQAKRAVGTEELQAVERRQSRLGEQAFNAEQESESREVQRELTYANLSQNERQLFENARQFDNKQDFDAYVVANNLNQQEADRAWKAYESQQNRMQTGELHYADLSMDEKKLAQQAYQFDSQMAFDQWATENNLDQKERDRVWQAVENERGRAQELTIQANSLINALKTMDYASLIKQNEAMLDNKLNYYAALGAAGTEPEGGIAALQASDPDAYYAYQAAAAGQSVAEINESIKLRNDFIRALITASTDPAGNSAMIAGIYNVAKGLGLDVYAPGRVLQRGVTSNQQTENQQTENQQTDGLTYGGIVPVSLGEGKGYTWDINSMPQIGQDFTIMTADGPVVGKISAAGPTVLSDPFGQQQFDVEIDGGLPYQVTAKDVAMMAQGYNYREGYEQDPVSQQPQQPVGDAPEGYYYDDQGRIVPNGMEIDENGKVWRINPNNGVRY